MDGVDWNLSNWLRSNSPNSEFHFDLSIFPRRNVISQFYSTQNEFPKFKLQFKRQRETKNVSKRFQLEWNSPHKSTFHLLRSNSLTVVHDTGNDLRHNDVCWGTNRKKKMKTSNKQIHVQSSPSTHTDSSHTDTGAQTHTDTLATIHAIATIVLRCEWTNEWLQHAGRFSIHWRHTLCQWNWCWRCYCCCSVRMYIVRLVTAHNNSSGNSNSHSTNDGPRNLYLSLCVQW